MHDPTGPETPRSLAIGCGANALLIGSGWCENRRPRGMGKIPNVNAGFGGSVGINGRGAGAARRQRGDGRAGRRAGIDATSAGMGIAGHFWAGSARQRRGHSIQATGAGSARQRRGHGHTGHGAGADSDAGRGYEDLLTSSGRAAWVWLHKLADRLERVRIVHGDWSRCLNNHFGGADTAVFLDPPYRSAEKPHGESQHRLPMRSKIWARDNADLRIALCGHRARPRFAGLGRGRVVTRRLTYSGANTTDEECVWAFAGMSSASQARSVRAVAGWKIRPMHGLADAFAKLRCMTAPRHHRTREALMAQFEHNLQTKIVGWARLRGRRT